MAEEHTVYQTDSIQAAVDGANSGDVIIVGPGTYTENININKNDLVIRSESGNPADTIIAANNSNASVITIQGRNHVTIKGFQITGAGTDKSGIYVLGSTYCTIEGNILYNDALGVYLKNSDNNIVRNNTASKDLLIGTGRGINLEQSNYTTVSDNTVSNQRYGIYVYGSQENTLSGNTASQSANDSILVENSINNVLESNTAKSNARYGIYLSGSSNNYLSRNIASSNSKGIYVMNSSENIISNNTVYNNTVEVNTSNGIMLSGSDGNTLEMNKAINNIYGISFDSSRNNTILSNNIASNSKFGLFLCSQSTFNLIFDNYLNNTMNVNNRNNGSVWNKTKTSGTNVMKGPYIGGNYWAKPDGTGFSQLNATYDTDGDGIIDFEYYGDSLIDYLPLVAVYVPEPVLPVANFKSNVTIGNAPLAVLFTDSSQNANSRSWDFGDGATSTEQNPTHIYSTAGNYNVNLTVNNLNGTNSKTAVITVLEEEGEENDGLPVVDFSVNVTSGYAPLSVLFTDLSQNATSRSWDVNNDGVEDSNKESFVYVYTSTGTYTAKLTAINANGTTSKTTLIAVERKSSGGSSSGGGGGGSPESSRNIEVKELSQVFITNGKAVKFDFAKNATCVAYVSFDAKKTAGKITTIAEQLKSKSSLVSELPSGEVYKSFNIWVGNGGYATSKNIENPEICFKVEKAWIQDKKIDQSSIALNRYSSKTWEQLPTSLLSEDEKYLYFTVETPGFSSFAITGKANTSPKETVTEIQSGDESDNSEENTEDTGSEAGQEPEQEEKRTPGFEMIYGVAGLLAVFLYKRK